MRRRRRLEEQPSVCWRLSAGRWTQRQIERGQLELSELRLAPGAQLPCALGGADDPHWPTTRLLIDEIAARVAPHAVWYCAPGFFGCER